MQLGPGNVHNHVYIYGLMHSGIWASIELLEKASNRTVRDIPIFYNY